MLIVWLIGFVINLIIFYLWRHTYDNEERIPINIIIFILLILSALTPILNIITGIILAVIIMWSYVEDDFEFRGPKWMTKEIK